jgi:glutamine synthetase
VFVGSFFGEGDGPHVGVGVGVGVGDGVGVGPGPSADTPYETKAVLLPKTLREAASALNDDPFFRQAMGAEFVDYHVHIKNTEIERFQAEVSHWEHREYFAMF